MNVIAGEGVSFNPVNEDLLNEYNAIRTEQNRSCFCHAPQRSIYFGFHGDAHPCCENLSYSYGKYPADSIHDIWFGEKRLSFRNYILHNDLSQGCSICEYYMKIGNFQGVKSRFYDNTPPAADYPSRMEFQLSNICNLECKMCDGWSSSQIRKNRDKLPPLSNPYNDVFVEQLKEFIPHLKQAHFVGGEPFVIPLFFKIWELITTMNPGCNITVQTNASVLNNRIKEIMENGNFSINVSLDSLNKATYEKIRKNASFEKTVDNVLWFMDYCKRKNTFFYFTPCPMKDNWKELPALAAYANEHDVRIIFHTVLYPRKSSFFGYSQWKLKKIYKILSAVQLDENNDNERFNKNSFLALLYQVAHFYNDRTQRKDWLIFEKKDRKYIRQQRKSLLKQNVRIRNEQRRALEKQKKNIKLLNRSMKLQELERKKHKKRIEKLKLMTNKQGHYFRRNDQVSVNANKKNVLHEFFWKEIKKGVADDHSLNKSEKEKTLRICKDKFDSVFANVGNVEAENDMIITIYSNVTMNNIIKSLLTLDEKQLIDGYLSHKNTHNG